MDIRRVEPTPPYALNRRLELRSIETSLNEPSIPVLVDHWSTTYLFRCCLLVRTFMLYFSDTSWSSIIERSNGTRRLQCHRPAPIYRIVLPRWHEDQPVHKVMRHHGRLDHSFKDPPLGRGFELGRSNNTPIPSHF